MEEWQVFGISCQNFDKLGNIQTFRLCSVSHVDLTGTLFSFHKFLAMGLDKSQRHIAWSSQASLLCSRGLWKIRWPGNCVEEEHLLITYIYIFIYYFYINNIWLHCAPRLCCAPRLWSDKLFNLMLLLISHGYKLHVQTASSVSYSPVTRPMFSLLWLHVFWYWGKSEIYRYRCSPHISGCLNSPLWSQTIWEVWNFPSIFAPFFFIWIS